MANKMVEIWHCPKCGAELRVAGVVESDGDAMPVFQCDRCVVKKKVFGEMFDVAFTFAVNAAGQPVDPGDDQML